MEKTSVNFLEEVLDSLKEQGRKVKLKVLSSFSRPPVEHEYLAIIEKEGSGFCSLLPWNYKVLVCQEPNEVYSSLTSVLYRAEDPQVTGIVKLKSPKFKEVRLVAVGTGSYILAP